METQKPEDVQAGTESQAAAPELAVDHGLQPAATDEPGFDFKPGSEISGEADAGTGTFSAATAEEVPVREEELPEPQGRPLTAEIKYPTSTPREKGGNPDELAIPAATRPEIDDKLDGAPNIDLVASAAQSKWAASLMESFKLMPLGNYYADRLDQSGTHWVQSITHKGIELRGKAPSVSEKPGTHETEGERAVLEMITHLGVGGLFYAPMWHSGFWVMFRPATEDELIDLNNRIAGNDKVAYGRQSYGMALSSTGIYTLDTVFQFAMDHVYYTSVRTKEMPLDQIRKYLRPQDVWHFIWGALCAMYPSGFFYSRACTNNPASCNHVVEETLNLTRLQVVNENDLTDWQKGHMTQRQPQVMAIEAVQRYQDEMLSMQKKRVVIVEGKRGVAMTFRSCDLMDYINEASAYLGSIIDSVNKALTEEQDASARNDQVNMRVKAAFLSQFAHWVDSVEFGDFTEGLDEDQRAIKIVRDRNSVINQLRALSATDSIRDKVVQEVKTYIQDTTIAVIGVDAYDCPACGEPQDETKYPRVTSIIPLDMLQVFFSLLTQRLGRVSLRM